MGFFFLLLKFGVGGLVLLVALVVLFGCPPGLYLDFGVIRYAVITGARCSRRTGCR